MTVLARLRRFWLDVHLWIGAGLGVLLLPVAVSGAALVWHDPLDQALHPARHAVSGDAAALPLSTYADAAGEAFGPHVRLSQIRLPEAPGAPVVVIGRRPGPEAPGARPRTLNAWIDPPTGKVLDVADPAQNPVQVLHRLHGSLMVPGIGRKVVGWLGWAMFVSCVTGLWLWWPRNADFVKALRWRRGPSKLFNLHHMAGFWVCVPLAVLSLTGVYISFPQTSRAVLSLATGQEAPAPRPQQRRETPFPLAQTSLDPQVAAARALETAPGASLASITYPTKGGEPAWRVQLKVPDAREPRTVQVADADGAVKADRGGGAGGGGRDATARLMRRIHDGTGMGIVWQVVIFLGGVGPAVLGITGVIMWLRRRRRRLAISRAAASD